MWIWKINGIGMLMGLDIGWIIVNGRLMLIWMGLDC